MPVQPTNRDLLPHFERYLEKRGVADNLLAFYRHVYTELSVFVGDLIVNTSFELIESFLENKVGAGLSPGRVKAYQQVLEAVLDFQETYRRSMKSGGFSSPDLVSQAVQPVPMESRLDLYTAGEIETSEDIPGESTRAINEAPLLAQSLRPILDKRPKKPQHSFFQIGAEDEVDSPLSAAPELTTLDGNATPIPDSWLSLKEELVEKTSGAQPLVKRFSEPEIPVPRGISSDLLREPRHPFSDPTEQVDLSKIDVAAIARGEVQQQRTRKRRKTAPGDSGLGGPTPMPNAPAYDETSTLEPLITSASESMLETEIQKPHRPIATTTEETRDVRDEIRRLQTNNIIDKKKPKKASLVDPSDLFSDALAAVDAPREAPRSSLDTPTNRPGSLPAHPQVDERANQFVEQKRRSRPESGRMPSFDDVLDSGHLPPEEEEESTPYVHDHSLPPSPFMNQMNPGSAFGLPMPPSANLPPGLATSSGGGVYPDYSAPEGAPINAGDVAFSKLGMLGQSSPTGEMPINIADDEPGQKREGEGVNRPSLRSVGVPEHVIHENQTKLRAAKELKTQEDVDALQKRMQRKFDRVEAETTKKKQRRDFREYVHEGRYLVDVATPRPVQYIPKFPGAKRAIAGAFSASALLVVPALLFAFLAVVGFVVMADATGTLLGLAAGAAAALLGLPGLYLFSKSAAELERHTPNATVSTYHNALWQGNYGAALRCMAIPEEPPDEQFYITAEEAMGKAFNTLGEKDFSDYWAAHHEVAKVGFVGRWKAKMFPPILGKIRRVGGAAESGGVVLAVENPLGRRFSLVPVVRLENDWYITDGQLFMRSVISQQAESEEMP